MSYEEWRKKKKEREQRANASAQVNSGSKPTTSSYSEWRANKIASGVDQNYINSFFSDANEYINSAVKEYESLGWSNASSAYTSRYGKWEDLNKRSTYISQWLGTNKDKYDEKTYKDLYSSIEGYKTSINTVRKSFEDAYRNYSQFKSEDDYNKASIGWLSDDAEYTGDYVSKRKSRYQSNLDRIAEIEAQLAEGAKPSDDNTPWWEKILGYLGGVQDTTLPVHTTNVQSNKKVDSLVEELDALKAENLQYERLQKTLDDYYTPVTPEFSANAAYRDYKNPTKDDLWNYDMSALEGSDVLTRGGYFDEEGNIRDSKGNIVQYANAPAIEDKLGLFLSASDEELTEAYNRLSATNGNYTDTWANLMQEGDVNGWKHLKEDEINTYYNCLLANYSYLFGWSVFLI
jgi:hypothetical protein